MCRLVARYADELNVSSAGPEKAGEAFARLDAACQREGRDPASVTRSAMTGVLVGRDEAEVRERVRELMRVLGRGEDEDADAWLAERRPRWIMGTPDEARERVAAMETACVQRLMLQDFLPRDLEMVKLLGEIFEL
jgi:alkanesulfonate monooxygenase SsuD/methylene tetrahydromethanopterin reductase-like flavin-dependent oxidoreductase (luciferase family)